MVEQNSDEENLAHGYTFTIDDDNAYKGVVGKYLKDNDIKHFVGNPKFNNENISMLVEAFNKTIIRNIFRLVYGLELQVKWVDFLDNIIDVYNNSVHSVIKQKPINIFFGKAKPVKVTVEDKSGGINIGNKVRILLNFKTFDKPSRTPAYSNEIYTVFSRNGYRFVLMDENFNILTIENFLTVS